MSFSSHNRRRIRRRNRSIRPYFHANTNYTGAVFCCFHVSKSHAIWIDFISGSHVNVIMEVWPCTTQGCNHRSVAYEASHYNFQRKLVWRLVASIMSNVNRRWRLIDEYILHIGDVKMFRTVCTSELSTGRMDPRVGSGRVGSRFCQILAGRVGSALRIF